MTAAVVMENVNWDPGKSTGDRKRETFTGHHRTVPNDRESRRGCFTLGTIVRRVETIRDGGA